MLAELENPPQNQGGYTASVQQQQWSPTTQPNYGTYGVSYRDIQSYNMQRPSRQIPPQPPPPPPMGRGEGRSAGNPNSGFHIPPWNRGGEWAEQHPNLQGHGGKGHLQGHGGKGQAYAQDLQEEQEFRAYQKERAAKAAVAEDQQQQIQQQHQHDQQHWDDVSQKNQQQNQQQQQSDWQPVPMENIFGQGSGHR